VNPENQDGPSPSSLQCSANSGETPTTKAAETVSAKQKNWWNWLKEHAAAVAILMSLVSLVFTGLTSCNSTRSANAATRSATAAALSASAALTNADWAAYQRNPDHNVIARVLRIQTVLRGWSSEDTNGFAYVDLALINNGNQSEIIRRVRLYFFDSADATGGPYSTRILNTLLPKGEKQVLHLVIDRMALTNRVWLKIGVTAVAPDASDIESTWPVARISMSPDGNGGNFSESPSEPIRVISNERLPHQKDVRFEQMME
jgi:hypothetical protein